MSGAGGKDKYTSHKQTQSQDCNDDIAFCLGKLGKIYSYMQLRELASWMPSLDGLQKQDHPWVMVLMRGMQI